MIDNHGIWYQLWLMQEVKKKPQKTDANVEFDKKKDKSGGGCLIHPANQSTNGTGVSGRCRGKAPLQQSLTPSSRPHGAVVGNVVMLNCSQCWESQQGQLHVLVAALVTPTD